MENKLTVHTDLDTISEAYTLLDSLGLSGLLLGKEIQISSEEILGELLKNNMLKRFLAIITHVDMNELPVLSGKDVVDTIVSFFVNIASDWGQLPGLIAHLIPSQPKAQSTLSGE